MKYIKTPKILTTLCVFHQELEKFSVSNFFQTKLELVWKASRQNCNLFSKPNWNWFGNGHRIKCSVPAREELPKPRHFTSSSKTVPSQTFS